MHGTSHHNVSLRPLLEWMAGSVLLGAGGSIYVLFRARTILYHCADAGLPCLAGVRSQLPAPSDFVLYSLPGFLWTASYILITDAVLRSAPLHVTLWWASLIPLLGVASELLQLLMPQGNVMGIRVGTFDVADLICYATPYIVYYVIKTYLNVQHQQ